jgi:hypothetical protein
VWVEEGVRVAAGGGLMVGFVFLSRWGTFVFFGTSSKIKFFIFFLRREGKKKFV